MSKFVRQVKQHTKWILPRLGSLEMELTERCNNDCVHCCINLPAEDSNVRRREMSTQQVKDILKQASDLGCMQVCFTGGEPLLRPDFEELYIYVRKLGIKVLLFTNARLINERLTDLFANIPPKVPIEITVYGMHKESYEAVTRSPGSFGQFWRGVNLLLERKVPFIVKSALLPENRADMEEFEAWAQTIPWMTKPPSYSMFFDLRNNRDNEAKNAQIKSLRLSPQEGISVLARDEARYRKDMSEFALKFMGIVGDSLFACGASNRMNIDAYGRAQPCMGLKSPDFMTDLATMSLEKALDSFSRLREIRATNPEYLYRCARCFLKGLCDQCPAKSWTESGETDRPVEYLCDVAHAKARFMGWLGNTERAWEVVEWSERLIGIPLE